MELEGENKIEIKSEDNLLQDKEGKVHFEDEVIRIRKDKIINFLKTRYNWITYVFLVIIVFIAVRIRTLNLGGLKDITTNDWTLGPDLDPFFFLRTAEYIVAHGKLFVVDTMRAVPLGLNVQEDYILHPYLIAWFHKIAVYFGSESVTYSAIIYPVFMFALTVIAFFFLARKIFLDTFGEKQASIIGLISTLFFSIMPIFLPRTIAGIPEKESVAFLFLFLAFYFFLCGWKSDKNISRYSFAILAGFATAAMANIWGGYVFIFLIIVPTVFILLLLGQLDKNKIYTYSTWVFSSYVLMYLFSSLRYSIKNILGSPYIIVAIVPIFIMLIHSLIFNTKLKNVLKYEKFSKIPPYIFSTILSILALSIIASFAFGKSFIPSQIKNVLDNLITPAASRLIQTVAENRQPFFTEWVTSFGPFIRGIPLFFWLFFLGSIYLFYKTITVFNKKERLYLTIAYFIFIFSLVFSRYSGESILNGTNFISLFLLGAGFILFISILGFYYYKYFKEKKEEKLKEINISFILLLLFFILCIITARATVRTIMMLVPPASIIVSYLAIDTYNIAKKRKEGALRIIAWIFFGIVLIAILFSGYQFYRVVSTDAAGYAPSTYTQQWQKAMAWVRENTPQNAVFAHWWDYGYWIQSIGERATVLDGGNAISYWNHLMGRFALTGTNDKDALEFLYAHNVTHFLIDSTDIGKYGAFSAIGSDINYDRRSFIQTFLRDSNQIMEKKNSTVNVYTGGSGLDEDIIYEDNETKIFLPAGKAGLGAILIEKNSSGNLINNPIGIFVYQEKQFRLPLRYAYTNKELIDFGSGIESGVYLFPRVGQNSIEQDGALLYLSKRTVKSQLARLYLYKENDPYFKLVHSEDDFIVTQVKAVNQNVEDIVFFQGLRGPIRIWEIKYPEDIELKKEYINTEYPPELYYA